MNNTIIILVIIMIILISLNSKKSIDTFASIEDASNIFQKDFNKDPEALRNLTSISKKLTDDGFTIPGPLNVKGPINIDMNIAHPDDGRYDGQIYRADGQTQIAVDDLLRIRDRNNKITGIELDVRPGVTPNYPSETMKISRKGIQFGDTNAGREANSAQISAGTHDADALCIVGMSNTKGEASSRKIHTWAEGGHKHEGPIFLNNNKLYLSGWDKNYNVDKNHSIGYNNNHDGPRVTGYNGGTFFTSKDNWTIGWNQDGNVDIRNRLYVGGRNVLQEILDLRNQGVRYNQFNTLNSRAFGSAFGVGVYCNGADGCHKNSYGSLAMGGPRVIRKFKFVKR